MIMFSCESKNASLELEEEVIAIHDEVMPKMGELKALKRGVREKIQVLSTDTLRNKTKIQDLRLLEQELEDAFENMFVWMRQYDNSSEDLDEDEKTQYFLQQKELVQVVNQDVKTAIELAEKELGKN